MKSISIFCTAVLSLALALPALAQTSPRVFPRDLEGIWISEPYLKALSETRMPHQTAKRVQPVVIGIQRHGRAYPVVITNFDKATVTALLDIQPDAQPGAYRMVLGPDDRPVSSDEATYIHFQGQRKTGGGFDRLRIAEVQFMQGRWADYVHLGTDLAKTINGLVVAGRYTDADGKRWVFHDNGESQWPDRSFLYELSLNDPTANCEYFTVEDMQAADGKGHYGYAWRGGKLHLFDARLANNRVRCSQKAMAVLTPQ
jgi:hypothetical protein